MTRMGRPPNPDLHKFWKISLPATLAGAVELALIDQHNNRPSYGARSSLIENLLRRWLAEQAQAERQAQESFRCPTP